MEWIFYGLMALMLGGIAMLCVAIFLAKALSPARPVMGSVHQPAGITPPPGNIPAGNTAPNPPPAANPAAVQRSKWKKYFGWVSTPSQSTALFIVGIAFLGALLLRMFIVYDGQWDYMWDVEPAWFYILCAVAVAIALWKVGSGLNRIPTTVTKYPKLFGVLGFVLVAYLLMLVFFPESRNFLLSGPGIGTLLLVMLGYSFFVILKAVFWKDSKLTALIMMAILLIILDVGITRMVPPAQRAEVRERLAALWPFSKSADSATSADCPGEPTTYSYRFATYRVNDKVCQLRGMVVEGCVTWLDSNNRFRGHSCEGETVPTVDGISRLKPDGTAIVTLNYCKPFAPGNLVEKCA